MKDRFVIQTPEQLRAVADPLRQRLLAAFAEAPLTVKAAAAQLGLPLTRLYHHVDLLEAAGLIAVVEEERRRGTMQRTFQAVARRFEVSAAAVGSEVADERARLARGALDEVLARAGPSPLHLVRGSARLTPEGLVRLEAAIGPLLKAQEDPAGEPVELLMVIAPGPPAAPRRSRKR